MKKLAIAGASLALAAMPVVGVFADDPAAVTVTDNITLNINESCTFSAGGAGLTPTDTISAGTETTFSTSGTHAFTVKCNSKAYTVSAQSSDLTNTQATAHGTIGYVSIEDYSTSTATPPVDGVWTAVLTGGNSNAAISKTSSTIKSGNATAGDAFSVAYKAYAGTAQNQGAYTGTVTYTLQGSNS